jgi:hypothetical protein
VSDSASTRGRDERGGRERDGVPRAPTRTSRSEEEMAKASPPIDDAGQQDARDAGTRDHGQERVREPRIRSCCRGRLHETWSAE